MTRTLRDVLREHAVRQREQAEEIARKRQAWFDAVNELLRQLESWLREADAEKVLVLIPTTVVLAEPTLGRYEVPGLIVRLHNQEVVIRPGGRDVYGTLGNGLRIQGRVDLNDGAASSYRILRVTDGKDERWVVRGPGYDAEPLTREVFDQVMAGILG